MDDANVEWRRLVEVPLKLRMALGLLPALPERMTRALEDWVAKTALPAKEAERLEPRFGFSTSADFRAVTWRTSVAASADGGRLVASLSEAKDEELARLDATIERLQPARVGDFIEARAEMLDRGWFLSLEAPFVRALATAPPTDAAVRLLAFAERHGVTGCSRIARSLGAGNPFTELLAPLPAGESRETLELGLRAFDELGIPRPPAPLREALARASDHGLALSVWLTGGGLSKLGLVAARPDTVQTLRLCAAVGCTEMDPLAGVEGALGVEGPAAIECAVTAEGAKVLMEYEL